MALTKSSSTLAQLTAGGNTASADVSAAYAAAFSIKHHTGTGTITAGGQVQPQVSHDGTNFYPDGGALQFGMTASADEYATYTPPEDGLPISAVRFAWTVPTGSTGHTLDVSYSKATGL
jgi:hypothetical protein